MKTEKNKNKLTSSEISNLHLQYGQETMSVWEAKHVLATTKDKDLIWMMKKSMELSQKHIKGIMKILQKEQIPIPEGITEKDVNLNAPSLFSDIFWLLYLHTLVFHGLYAHSLAMSVSTRKDVREFYYQCNIDAMDIYNQSVEVLQSRNLYEAPPSFTVSKEIDYIKKYSYMMDVIGKKRPLNASEAGSLFINLTMTRSIKTLCIGFYQVAKNKKVQSFIGNILPMITKNYQIFSSLLMEENIRFPKTLDTEVTTSTESPFSDKFIMQKIGMHLGAAVAYYGNATIASLRADITTNTEMAILRVLKHVPEWGHIVVKNAWLEKPFDANDQIEL